MNDMKYVKEIICELRLIDQVLKLRHFFTRSINRSLRNVISKIVFGPLRSPFLTRTPFSAQGPGVYTLS